MASARSDNKRCLAPCDKKKQTDCPICSRNLPEESAREEAQDSIGHWTIKLLSASFQWRNSHQPTEQHPARKLAVLFVIQLILWHLSRLSRGDIWRRSWPHRDRGQTERSTNWWRWRKWLASSTHSHGPKVELGVGWHWTTRCSKVSGFQQCHRKISQFWKLN